MLNSKQVRPVLARVLQATIGGSNLPKIMVEAYVSHEQAVYCLSQLKSQGLVSLDLIRGVYTAIGNDGLPVGGK